MHKNILSQKMIPFALFVGLCAILIYGYVSCREFILVKLYLYKLESNHHSEYKWASSKLGSIGSRMSIEGLLNVWRNNKDYPAGVSNYVSIAFIKIGARALPDIIKSLHGENDFVKCRAAEVLGKIGKSNQNAIDSLVDCLSADNSEVVLSAARALEKIGVANKEAFDKITAMYGAERVSRYFPNLNYRYCETNRRIGEVNFDFPGSQSSDLFRKR